MSWRSRAEQPLEPGQLRCPECGSQSIACEREAILVASVAELRDGALILTGPLTPQPLDDVQLICTECAAELAGVEWSEERPRAVPRDEQPLTDDEALDALAVRVNEPGECNGGDLVELVSQLLPRTGREVVDDPTTQSRSPVASKPDALRPGARAR